MAYGQVVDCINMYTVHVHVMMYWYIHMHSYIHSVEKFHISCKTILSFHHNYRGQVKGDQEEEEVGSTIISNCVHKDCMICHTFKQKLHNCGEE